MLFVQNMLIIVKSWMGQNKEWHNGQCAKEHLDCTKLVHSIVEVIVKSWITTKIQQ